MDFKFVFVTGPFLVLVFLSFVLSFIYQGPIYCWMTCLQPEISCLATVSFTFGLVPATTLAASSAISGCLASFDVCELSCAKRSQWPAFSPTHISDSCVVFRNGTKIKAAEIKNHRELTNPFDLDADCRLQGLKPALRQDKRFPRVVYPTITSTTVAPNTTAATTVQPTRMKYPIVRHEHDLKDNELLVKDNPVKLEKV